MKITELLNEFAAEPEMDVEIKEMFASMPKAGDLPTMKAVEEDASWTEFEEA